MNKGVLSNRESEGSSKQSSRFDEQESDKRPNLKGDRAMDWEAQTPTVIRMVNPADRSERDNAYRGRPLPREWQGSQQRP